MKKMIGWLLLMAFTLSVIACGEKKDNAEGTAVPGAATTETQKPTDSAKPADVVSATPAVMGVPGAPPKVDLINDPKLLAMVKIGDPNKLIDSVFSWIGLFNPMANPNTAKGLIEGQLQIKLDEYPANKNAAIVAMMPQNFQPDPKMALDNSFVVFPFAETSSFTKAITNALGPKVKFGTVPAGTMFAEPTAFDALKPGADSVQAMIESSMEPNVWAVFNVDTFYKNAGQGLFQQLKDTVLLGIDGQIQRLENSTEVTDVVQLQQVTQAKQALTVIFDGVDQLLKQIQSVGLGISFKPESVNLIKVAQLKADSALVKSLSKSTPTEDLAQFVDDKAFIRANSSMNSDTMAAILNAVKPLMEIDKNQNAMFIPLFDELIASAPKLGVFHQAVAYGFVDNKIVIENVLRCDDIQLYADLMTKWEETTKAIIASADIPSSLSMALDVVPVRMARGIEVKGMKFNMAFPEEGLENVPKELADVIRGLKSFQMEYALVNGYLVSTVNKPIETVMDRVLDKKLTAPMASTKDGLGVINLDVNVGMIVSHFFKPAAEHFKNVTPVTLGVYAKGDMMWNKLSFPRDLANAISETLAEIEQPEEMDVDIELDTEPYPDDAAPTTPSEEIEVAPTTTTDDVTSAA